MDANGWISVKEQLPEFLPNSNSVSVNVWVDVPIDDATDMQGVASYDYNTELWYDSAGDFVHGVTHWRPLPPRPGPEEASA